MNNGQATPHAPIPHRRVASGAAGLLDQEIKAMAPLSATLALCAIGSAQDLAVTTVRLMVIIILVVITLTTSAVDSPDCFGAKRS